MRNRTVFSSLAAAIITLMLGATPALAQNLAGPAGEDDTILVEKEASQKIPYHKILKKLSKQLLNFNTEKVVTFGEGRRDSIVRNFSDLSSRMKYRVDVNRDELEFKFSLNF